MPEYCSIDKSDHIMTVTLERPNRLNALHPPANAELGEVFDDFAADDDAWVAIITGSGRGFSAGVLRRHTHARSHCMPRHDAVKSPM